MDGGVSRDIETIKHNKGKNRAIDPWGRNLLDWADNISKAAK